MEEIKIDKEKVIKEYRNAKKNNYIDVMIALRNLFGSEILPPVETFSDAVNRLGEEHPYVIDITNSQHLAGQPYVFLMLRIICEALNEEWKPDFTICQPKYYPYFKDGKIEVGRMAGNGNIVSPLCLKSEELARYCGKQFIEYWKEFLNYECN